MSDNRLVTGTGCKTVPTTFQFVLFGVPTSEYRNIFTIDSFDYNQLAGMIKRGEIISFTVNEKGITIVANAIRQDI